MKSAYVILKMGVTVHLREPEACDVPGMLCKGLSKLTFDLSLCNENAWFEVPNRC
jgi:hypothetical protein